MENEAAELYALLLCLLGEHVDDEVDAVKCVKSRVVDLQKTLVHQVQTEHVLHEAAHQHHLTVHQLEFEKQGFHDLFEVFDLRVSFELLNDVRDDLR